MGADDARMHTALMYTDDVVLAAVGAERVVALLRAFSCLAPSHAQGWSCHGHPGEVASWHLCSVAWDRLRRRDGSVVPASGQSASGD
eukprot:2430602-Pleurochrysis_carterae.AAC.1